MSVKSNFYNEYDIKNNEKHVLWAQRSLQNHHQTFHDQCPEKIGPLPKKSDHWFTRTCPENMGLASYWLLVGPQHAMSQFIASISTKLLPLQSLIQSDSVYHKDAYVQILMGNTKYMEIPNDRWGERTLTGRGPTDYGPGSEIGVGWKIGVTWSRKRGFKMAATELGYLLTKLSFWLSLWRDINFLAWRQRIISLVWFANNAIHLWPQVMPIFDREMPPGLSGFTPAICLSRNFVYVSILENRGDKSLDQNF